MGRLGYRPFNRDTRGRLRYTRFSFIRATRCIACLKPIILTIIQGEVPRLMAVDSMTWDGNSYYVRGKHRPHNQSCPEFQSKLADYRSLRDQDLVVEG